MHHRETKLLSGLESRHRRRGGVVTRTAALLAGLAFVLSSCGTLHADEPNADGPQLGVAAACGTTNVAQGKSALASSWEQDWLKPRAAVDGDMNTRWGSAWSDPQWFQVNLGSPHAICGVTLEWEGNAAYGKAFKIQVTNNPSDDTAWTTIYETSTGKGGTQVITPTKIATGRYVRLTGTQRGTGYGYSLREFRLFDGGGTCSTANAALYRPASASSEGSADTPARAAVDGDHSTRWSSAGNDSQVLQVDLGSNQYVCEVTLRWGENYAKAYDLLLSDGPYTGTLYDYGTNFNIGRTSVGRGGTETLSTDTRFGGRYLKISFQEPADPRYGFSLYEVEVRTVDYSTTPPSTTSTSSISTVR